MRFDDKFFALYRTGDLAACNRLLDEHSPGRDQEGRHSIAYWRAVLLDREGRPAEALDVLNAASADFNCRSGFTLQQAQLLRNLGRIPDAIATLEAAPIMQEVATFPGLAWEAAYFCCYLIVKQGDAPPRDLLDLIPDDFETMLDGQFLAKSNLVSGRF